MAANLLNSARAVQMSVFVVRAFLKMRALLGDKRELAKQLATLEKEQARYCSPCGFLLDLRPPCGKHLRSHASLLP